MAKRNSKKKGKKVRVDFRPNRNQPPRDKSWTREFREHGFQDRDTIQRQSLNPKGDISRKRTIIEDGDVSDRELRDGRVLAMRGLIAEVDDGTHIWPCTVRRILKTRVIEERNPVVVGDRVQFFVAADTAGVEREGMIYSVDQRTSQLTRRYSNRVHVVAANVDQVLIVASIEQPPLKPQLIDRYLVAAHAGNIKPVICINKIDLGQPQALFSVAEMYNRIGYESVLVSAITGTGVESLKDHLRNLETVIVGQSGVGKSSILNAVQPGLRLATREVSEVTEKGKHTTTTAELLKLDIGGYVVDTPGIRSYDLAVVPANEYEMHFVEFAEYVPHCKFPDCTHIHEQDCAVKAAVEQGCIDPRRHESYRRLYEEG